ncbi:ComEC/Rec2 family competence protein [Breoghania sp. L-A4]|uniref:ComEC/Rec2 family competence protein n=1 Tax=Breoghania sp. L-A4 TaxID=2304600 RepID=UPI0013C2F168|nr:ComEC/Rec2 family competence protein [Breoghania sp. L-A4]
MPRVSKPVRFLARLSPPGGAVLPGGYAFDQAAYFASIGASGFVYGDLKPVVDAGDWPEPGWRLHLGGALTDIRFAISARIRDSLSDPATGTDSEAGGIAAALIVGDRGGVSEAAQESLRVAGLAHVLAISGMHMALVAGTIFFAVRAVLAASPALALGYPIRHWAAGAALVAATVYLALSGASIATQRAYIMAAIVFIAMLSGRRALTMRSVAVAALLILAASPEALLQPGFQMSFAAVIALVAAYEAWRKRGARETTRAGHTLWHGLRFWIAGLLVTSLIAGLATAPIAAVHFYRTAPLGLLANMAAMPLVSLVIMPAAVASVLAMPFGLDPLPLSAMGAGIDAMLAIAETVARWTPSGGLVGAVPPVVGLACVAGLLLLALLKSRWRLIGLAPISLAAVLHFGFPPSARIF